MKKLIGMLNNRKGFTLVEVIVSALLTVMLIGAAAGTVTAFSKVYLSVNRLVRAQSVAVTLGDEIYGQLFLASGDVYISEDGSRIDFVNSDGFNIAIYADKGRLNVLYKEVIDAETERVLSEAVEWYYPDKAYMQNKLTAVKFSKVEDTSVIKSELTLTDTLTGEEYTSEVFTECVNIESEFIVYSSQ